MASLSGLITCFILSAEFHLEINPVWSLWTWHKIIPASAEVEIFVLQLGGEQGGGGQLEEGLWQGGSAMGQDFGERAAKVPSAPDLGCRNQAHDILLGQIALWPLAGT